MAVKIRLTRRGSKRNPYYRVVVADSRSPRDGRYIEQIGTYNPLVKPVEVKIDEEKALKWLHNGAQPRDRKSTRLNSSHVAISYAVFCLKKKNIKKQHIRIDMM